MSERMKKEPKNQPTPSRWSRPQLDAHDEEEALMGFFSGIEEKLKLPFEVSLFGSAVTVEGVRQSEEDEIVAVCVRGNERRTVSVLDLPLPDPPPPGAEWIEAYRLWKRGRMKSPLAAAACLVFWNSR